jgi:molybdenum cofactor cytidylyltransferase
MQPPILFAGLILAAGNSTRMGTDKAMLPWPPSAQGVNGSPGHTLLSAALAALDPFTRITVVVGGKNTDAIAGTASACGAYLVRNPEPENGQFSSLQIGLSAALEHGCNAAIITPVDCPPLSATSLERLYHAFVGAHSQDFWAVAPEHEGKHGHPLLAGPHLISAFLDAPVASTAREILHANASRVVYVPVPDSLAKSGMNTPEDYAAQAESPSPEN